VDNHDSPYVVGEFNCSCVGVDKFAAAVGGDLKAVAAADKKAGYKLTDLVIVLFFICITYLRGRGERQEHHVAALVKKKSRCYSMERKKNDLRSFFVTLLLPL
jgi:hypothetical protein